MHVVIGRSVAAAADATTVHAALVADAMAETMAASVARGSARMLIAVAAVASVRYAFEAAHQTMDQTSPIVT